MKYSSAIHILLGFVSAAHGLVLPKDDDEWTLVLYNAGASGGQCGGTSSVQSGGADACVPIPPGKACADIKVADNLPPGTTCTFSFKTAGSGCSGTTKITQTVRAGHESDGVNLNDDVKFVSVGCFGELVTQNPELDIGDEKRLLVHLQE